MGNPVEAAIAILDQHGIWSLDTQVITPFLNALAPLLPAEAEQREVAAHVVLATEATFLSYNRNRMLLARLCALLKRLTGLKTAQVATALAAAAPDLIRSLSWVSKLVKAGGVLLDRPELADLENIDKLATLSRIPKKLQDEIFASGKLPDGVVFRELDRQALAEAVDRLRTGRPSAPVHPHREARQELLRLVRRIGPIVDQLSTLPEFGPLLAKLSAWQVEIVKTVETTPIPRLRAPVTIGGNLISA